MMYSVQTCGACVNGHGVKSLDMYDFIYKKKQETPTLLF